jgi:hypothetical protein
MRTHRRANLQLTTVELALLCPDQSLSLHTERPSDLGKTRGPEEATVFAARRLCPPILTLVLSYGVKTSLSQHFSGTSTTRTSPT